MKNSDLHNCWHGFRTAREDSRGLDGGGVRVCVCVCVERGGGGGVLPSKIDWGDRRKLLKKTISLKFSRSPGKENKVLNQ